MGMVIRGSVACQSGSDARKVGIEIISNIFRIRKRLVSMGEKGLWKRVLLIFAQDVVDFTPGAFYVILSTGESTGIMISLGHPDYSR